MPKKLEQQLKKRAKKKGLTDERKNAYIYGTMRETGWKPKREERIRKGISRLAKKGRKRG